MPAHLGSYRILFDDDLLALLREVSDIIAERPSAPTTPGWVTRRGWASVLNSISDAELDAAERDPVAWLAGHEHDGLRALGTSIHAATHPYEDRSTPPDAARQLHVKRRKQHQIEALCAIAEQRFADAGRVVDLGSGHGHLTRALDRTLGARETVGIDSNAERIATALALGGRFVCGDAATEPLGRGDLVVGLHPCGELGDALVRRARDAHAHVLMVSCCFQKTAASERRAISQRANGWTVPRTSLGLANLAMRSFEGSGSLAHKRQGRVTRLALRFALRARGLDVAPGDEARGVTKERIARGLSHAAAHAFRRRELSAPSDIELEAAWSNAKHQHARIARYSLPRHALARVLELGIVLDRACHLHEGGWDVDVRPLFSSRISPRNLGIIARRSST